MFGFFGGQAAVDGVKNGQLRLFDRRDGVVDGRLCLPLAPVGAVFGAFHIVLVLSVRDVDLQVVHVVGDLRLHGAPVSVRSVVSRLNLLIDLFDCLGCGRVRLLLSGDDLVACLLFGRIRCLFSALGANRQIGELIGESLSHLFALLERNGAVEPL